MSPNPVKRRSVNGILLLDKPLDLTSSQAMSRAKGIFRAQKAGHTGSLDPKATGLLPVCFGEATKFSSFFLEGDKTYTASAKLGVRTSTQDTEGEVIAKREVGDHAARLEEVLARFTGKIEQVPSRYSAIKVDGRPLYKYARAGQEVRVPKRTVEIYSIMLTKRDGDTFEIVVRCSKGTYIRTLIDDIGQELGCGAHLTALRRNDVQGLPSSPLHTLTELQQIADTQCHDGVWSALDSLLLPIETALSSLPRISLPHDTARRLSQGLEQDLDEKQIDFNRELVWEKAVCLECDGRFIGIVRFEGSRVRPVRMMSEPPL